MELQTQDKLGCACPLFTEAEKKPTSIRWASQFLWYKFQGVIVLLRFLCPGVTLEFYFGASQQISSDVNTSNVPIT